MSLHIAMTGSSGMIGTALSLALMQKGHSVTPIIRPTTPLQSNRRVIRWDIEQGKIDAQALEGYEVVIHLAGANIANERWSPPYKKMMEQSRLKGTTLLCNTLAQLKKPPRVLLSASAVGFYGHGSVIEKKDEMSPAGRDFLAQLCKEWEAAVYPAQRAGIRVVTMRTGMVLDKFGGALPKMLPIFRLGLGGKIGSGKQIMSWVALAEIPYIVLHIINNEKISGAVNFVSPQAVTNEEFTRALGAALRRPAVFPLPGFAARVMFGEMADSLLLNGAHVVPKKLLESGYSFVFSELKGAFDKILA